MHYNHEAGKKYVKLLGMQWDEVFAERVDGVALKSGLTQPQWDVMVHEYAWRVKCLFTPSLYPWRARILLALHFINPFAKGL